MELVARFLSEPSAPRTMVIVWTVVMICVPIVRWVLGEGAERIGIATGVFAQVAAVVVAIWGSFGAFTVAVVVLVPLLGWTSEVIGWRTGFPFGKYSYTDVLQPQVAGVPVLIPLAWLMMMPPAWAVGYLVSPDRPVIAWLVAAAAFTAWDVYLDPQMVSWKFWKWEANGIYLGIPLSNYAGWFSVSFVITAIVAMIAGASAVMDARSAAGLVTIYAITWVLQFIGQFVFWKMRVAAVAGFVAMGLFIVAMIVAA
ncbi:MAG: carotenoid biosynthesis protein [Spirochaetaceae bacterium]|nr:MAG: carotenoid biosynthesis protein [Spirochaetaceae bacterium]